MGTANWKIEHLKAPSSYSSNPKTQWTEAGLAYREVMQENKKACAPKPGEHYTVIDCADPLVYLSYPQSWETELLRHSIVMVRRKRPHVPQPNGTPLPTTKLSAEERCRIFSVYLRPWVLSRQHASPHVPFLADIDISISHVIPALQKQRDTKQGSMKLLRLRGKQYSSAYKTKDIASQYPAVDCNGKLFKRSYADAWRDYRCAHVVSKYAAKIIQQFAASHLADSLEAAENNEEDHSKRERLPVDNSWMSLNAVHDILRNSSSVERSNLAENTKPQASKFAHQIEAAKSISERLWSLPDDRQGRQGETNSASKGLPK